MALHVFLSATFVVASGSALSNAAGLTTNAEISSQSNKRLLRNEVLHQDPDLEALENRAFEKLLKATQPAKSKEPVELHGSQQYMPRSPRIARGHLERAMNRRHAAPKVRPPDSEQRTMNHVQQQELAEERPMNYVDALLRTQADHDLKDESEQDAENSPNTRSLPTGVGPEAADADAVEFQRQSDRLMDPTNQLYRVSGIHSNDDLSSNRQTKVISTAADSTQIAQNVTSLASGSAALSKSESRSSESSDPTPDRSLPNDADDAEDAAEESKARERFADPGFKEHSLKENQIGERKQDTVGRSGKHFLSSDDATYFGTTQTTAPDLMSETEAAPSQVVQMSSPSIENPATQNLWNEEEEEAAQTRVTNQPREVSSHGDSDNGPQSEVHGDSDIGARSEVLRRPSSSSPLPKEQDVSAVAAAAAAQQVVAASRGTERYVSMKDAASAVASAAVTAARVAASLPANIPEEVRNAALQAAASAAAEVTFASPGRQSEHLSWTPQPIEASRQTSERRSPSTVREENFDISKSQMADLDQHKVQIPKSARRSEQPGVASGILDEHGELVKKASRVKKVRSNRRNVRTSQSAPILPPPRVAHLATASNLLGDTRRSAKPMDSVGAPDQRKLLYVGIFSRAQDFDQRNIVRKAWVTKLRRQNADNGKVRVDFVIGRRPQKEQATQTPVITTGDTSEVPLDGQLNDEFHTHGDVFRIPYEELPVAVLMFFAHAVEMRYRFVLKMDIERELLYQPLITSLQRESPDMFLYAGQQLRDANLLESAERNIKKYFAGSCYLASWSLAQRISKMHLDHSIMLWSYNTEGADIDDMDMGQWVAWEDKLLLESSTAKRRQSDDEGVEIQRVDYRIMDMCRRPLPARVDIRFND